MENAERARSMSLENVAQVVLELRDSMRALSDEVVRLNQAVARLSREDRAVLPRRVQWALIVTSVAVTAACATWLLDRLL
jgi:hypothetical protein